MCRDLSLPGCHNSYLGPRAFPSSAGPDPRPPWIRAHSFAAHVVAGMKVHTLKNHTRNTLRFQLPNRAFETQETSEQLVNGNQCSVRSRTFPVRLKDIKTSVYLAPTTHPPAKPTTCPPTHSLTPSSPGLREWGLAAHWQHAAIVASKRPAKLGQIWEPMGALPGVL